MRIPLTLTITLIVALRFASPACAAVLSGMVLDQRGNPVPSVRLAAVQAESGQRILLVTDANGRFRAEVGAGSYSIYAVDPESRTPLIGLALHEDGTRHIVFHMGPGGLNAAAPPDLPAVESEPRPAKARVSSLDEIRAYQVIVRESDASRTAERSMVELVNPFPQKRRGKIHGSIYEFHRNDNFDARNFFDPLGKPLPEYKRNQFGLSLGLALNARMNLLGTYDGIRIHQGSTLLTHIPAPEMKRGDFSRRGITLRDPATGEALAGNRIPEGRIHPVAKRLIPLFPEVNRDDPDRNFVNNQPIIRNRDSFTFRWNYQPKQQASFVGRYSLTEGFNTYVRSLPSQGGVRHERDQDAGLSYSDKLRPDLLLHGRFSFSRSADALNSVNSGRVGLLESLGIEGLSAPDAADQGYPDFRFSGYASFGDAGYPVLSFSNSFEYEGQLTWTSKSHTVRAGAELTAYQTNNARSDGLRKGRFSFNGYYSGDAFADFLLGLPDTATRSIGTDRSDIRRKSWNLFVRDDWKLGPRLSVGLGLTYFYFQPYRSVHRNVATFHPLLFDPPPEGEMVVVGTERARTLGLGGLGKGGMVFPDRNDWAPSLYLALRPMGNNSLVLRSGYYLSYFGLGRESYVSYLSRNFPFYYTETALSTNTEASLDLGRPFASAAPAEIGVRAIDPHLRTTTLQNWYMTLQTEISRLWRIEGSYRATRATNAVRTIPANVPLPGPGAIQPRRPNPRFGRLSILSGGGAYTRHVMEWDAERRLGGGVSLKAGLTWNSYLSDLYGHTPSNPRNLRAERGRSDWVVPCQFHLSYIMDLPFGKNGRFGRGLPPAVQPLIGGWRLSGITHFQDGARFSIYSSGDPNNDGLSEERPDRLGPGSLDAGKRSIDRWFAIEHFASPAPYGHGNAGRNILAGPAYANWDLSVIKQTRFGDGHLVELRIEFFNAFNQVNFEPPGATIGTSLFGKIFGAHRAREIEIALRYSF